MNKLLTKKKKYSFKLINSGGLHLNLVYNFIKNLMKQKTVKFFSAVCTLKLFAC